MKFRTFLSFILLLTTLLSFFYGKLLAHFDNKDVYTNEISQLEKELKRENFKRLLAENKLQEFRVEVAQVLPEAIKFVPKGEKSYPLRTLASVVNEQNKDNLRVHLAEAQMEKAKKYFRNKEYNKAEKALKSFIQKSSYSIHITEAYFLLVEVYFQLQNFEESLLTAEKMLELFPESELTGYALLRSGKIYEYLERPEEAIDIYKTVLKVFPQRGIASQASQSLRSVEL